MLYSNLRAFCAAAVILVAATSSQADPIELGWNSSPDASVAGYIVYVGRASGAYTETYNVGNTTTYTYPSAVAGQRYYFAVAAYDGQIRVLMTATADGYSRLTELEAYTTSTPPPPPTAGTNVALASAGAVVTASSTYGSGFLPATVIDGRRAGTAWGTNGGWADATPGSFPDWIEVDFPTSYAISQVNVFSVQDNYATPAEPTASQTFTWYGLRDFAVQYWTGSPVARPKAVTSSVVSARTRTLW